MKLQKDVVREIKHIAIGVSILCVLLNVIFLLCGKWDFTVLWGSLFGSAWSILNFVLLGYTVQKAAATKDEGRSKNIVQLSYSLRLLVTGGVLLLGFVLPCFHWLAVLPTALFQRITIFLMQLTGMTKKEDKSNGTDA